jgi:hypothetical protein
MYLPILYISSFFEFDELLFIPLIVFVASKNYVFSTQIFFSGSYPKQPNDKYKKDKPWDFSEFYIDQSAQKAELDRKIFLFLTKRHINSFKYNFSHFRNNCCKFFLNRGVISYTLYALSWVVVIYYLLSHISIEELTKVTWLNWQYVFAARKTRWLDVYWMYPKYATELQIAVFLLVEVMYYWFFFWAPIAAIYFMKHLVQSCANYIVSLFFFCLRPLKFKNSSYTRIQILKIMNNYYKELEYDINLEFSSEHCSNHLTDAITWGNLYAEVFPQEQHVIRFPFGIFYLNINIYIQYCHATEDGFNIINLLPSFILSFDPVVKIFVLSMFDIETRSDYRQAIRKWKDVHTFSLRRFKARNLKFKNDRKR